MDLRRQGALCLTTGLLMPRCTSTARSKYPNGFRGAVARFFHQETTGLSTPRCTRLLALDEAAARVRAFLEQPDARFSAKYMVNESVVIALYPLLPDGATTKDVFIVNARSGLMSDAYFNEQGVAPALAQPLTDEQARVQAEAYARAHFPAFATVAYDGVLLDQSREPRYGVDEDLFVASWQLVAPESGAYLPTRVQVAISPRSGQIVGYSARQDAYSGPTVPRITREAAVTLAQAAQRTKGFPDTPVAGVALYGLPAFSLNANQTDPMLAWVIQFQGYVPVYIDAFTGER